MASAGCRWLADDLAITCKLTGTSDDRAAGLSIKSDRQVTAAGFPADFVRAVWEQWLGIGTSRAISSSADVVVLAVGELSQNVEAAWSRLLREASEATPERLVARLSSSKQGGGSQASELQRALFSCLHCPKELRDQGDTSEEVTARLVSQVRLFRFDYKATPSRHMNEAIADCQKVCHIYV